MKKRIIIVGLGLVALALVGAGCAGTEVAETTNSSDEAQNTNTVTNSETATETTNQNTNNETVVNANEKGDAVTGNGKIDTNDWLTYQDEEYGFSLKHPENWSINETKETNNARVRIIDTLYLDTETSDRPRPKSQVGPENNTELKDEIERLKQNKDSEHGGEWVITNEMKFYKYLGYIEGGTLVTRYLAPLDSNQVMEIKYYAGDNSNYADALENFSRTELLNQYSEDMIENTELAESYRIFNEIVATVKIEF